MGLFIAGYYVGLGIGLVCGFGFARSIYKKPVEKEDATKN